MHIVEMSAIRLCITEYKSEQMLPWASATNDFNDNPSLRTHQYFLCIEHTETFHYYLHKKRPRWIPLFKSQHSEYIFLSYLVSWL